MRQLQIVICWIVLMSNGLVLRAAPPVELEHRGYTRDKWLTHCFALKLTNQSDTPKWIILPVYENLKFPESGKLVHEYNVGNHPIEGINWENKSGTIRRVNFWGGFDAFHVPPHGELEISQYEFNNGRGGEGLSEIVVLEAAELRVNGKTLLEDWLPFRTMCDKKAKIVDDDRPSKDVDWKVNNGQQSDYSSEKVEYLEAQGLDRWTIKFQSKGEMINLKPYPLQSGKL